MSILRNTVLATVVIGAGLGSMSGAALAWDHAPAKGCSNAIKAESENGAGRTLGDTTGGDQDLSGDNLCDIFNGNELGSENNTATAGGTIRNGDLTDITKTSTTNSSSNSSTSVLGGLIP